MQESITTVVEWVIAVDPATLKWSAAVLLAVFFGLLLFGLFQYQAYDRKWGLKLVLGLAGGAVVAGLGVSLHWTLGVLYGVGYGLTWLAWVLTRRLTGWRQHLLRGLAAAVCLGPWLWVGATEYASIDGSMHEYVYNPVSGHVAAKFAAWVVGNAGFWLVFMLPGVLWLALLVGGWSWWRVGRRTAGAQPRVAHRVAVAALVVVNLLGLNWYVAGRFDVVVACRDGRPWTVGYVVFSRPGDVRQPLSYGETLLQRAADGGHAEVIRVLLTVGAPINARDAAHETPLHWAARTNAADVVGLLLAAGADVNAKDIDGKTPLHIAVQDKTYAAVVRALLAGGAAVNAQDNRGVPPLYEAAARGDAEMVALLLPAGADVNARGPGGTRPLHEAASWGSARVVGLALAAGAEVNAVNCAGQTALDFCGHPSPDVPPEDQKAVEDLLLQRGAKTKAELNAEKNQPAPAPAKPEPGQ